MQRALAVGLRRLGDVERRAADRAHDLVLDVVEGRARLAAAPRRASGGAASATASSASAGGSCVDAPVGRAARGRGTAASTVPRLIGDDPALAVDDERLGQARVP